MSIRQGSTIVAGISSSNYNDLSNKPQINSVELIGNKSSDDLNIQSKDGALNFDYISNCITKLPQNINLELNNGTLTLKSGSKVYKPNGERVNITIDKSQKTNYNADCLCFVNLDSNSLSNHAKNLCYSQEDTPPSSGQVWYKPSTKEIFVKSSTTDWALANYSLPIADTTATTNGISLVKQIFNNFSYIGTQIFILPGIEGLISNGRTENGNLKNISFSINNVITYPLYTGDQSLRSLILYYNTTTNNFDLGIFDVINDILTERIYIQEIEPDIIDGGYKIWYQPSSNKWKVVKSDGIWKDALPFIIDSSTKEDDLSNTFLPNNTIQITDYNVYNKLDCLSNIGKDKVSTLSAPSNKYINLELQASNTVYTMPANGYLCLAKAKSESNTEEYIGLRNQSTGLATNGFTSIPSNFIRVNLPVKKNDKIIVYYSATGTVDYFRFVYAEGAK